MISCKSCNRSDCTSTRRCTLDKRMERGMLQVGRQVGSQESQGSCRMVQVPTQGRSRRCFWSRRSNSSSSVQSWTWIAAAPFRWRSLSCTYSTPYADIILCGIMQQRVLMQCRLLCIRTVVPPSMLQRLAVWCSVQQCTVSFFEFKPQQFKSRFSDPRFPNMQSHSNS